MAVGTAVSTIGAYQQAQAAKQQANFQRQQAEVNAIIAQQNAADVRDRGKVAEEEQRDQIAQNKGTVRAAEAAHGFLVDDPGSTNVDQLVDLAGKGELDVLRIRDNTLREERRALIQADNFTAQAGAFGAQASNINPAMSAGGTLLSGAGSAAGNFKSLTKVT